MEYLAGAGLVVLGLGIIVFAHTKPDTRGGVVTPWLRFRHWFNTAVTWMMGLACIGFGASLLVTGRIHF